MKQKLYTAIIGLISFLIFMSSAGRVIDIEMFEVKEIMILTAVQMYFVFLSNCNNNRKGVNNNADTHNRR